MHALTPSVARQRGAAVLVAALGWFGPVHAQSGPYTQAPPVLERPATGLFGFLHHPLPILPGHGLADRIVPADLDGDGHLDLLSSTSASSLFVLLGDGSGAFARVSHEVRLLTPPGTAAVGDVDGDGDFDAYVDGHVLLLNDGAGGFSDGSAGLPPSTSGGRRFLTDVELDGDLDIVVWGDSSAHAQFRNDGLGTFTDASASMPSLSFASLDMVMGDVDGDGDADFLSGADLDQQSHLFLDQGGTYVDATANLPVAFFSAPAVALSDVDGDGDLDALLHKDVGFTYLTQVHLNDGTGVFTLVPGAAPVSGSPRLEVGDLDGDGDPDLLSQRVMWNDGSGLFSPGYEPFFGRGLQGPMYPALLADADEDGDLDAFVLRYDSFNELFLNDGSGVLTSASPSAFEVDDQIPFTFVVGDLDGDLAPDLYRGNDPVLLLNDGSGSFTDVSATHLPTTTPNDILNEGALGDVDEDGTPDLVLALTSNYQAFRVLLNDGSAHFQEPPSYPPAVAHTFDVALGDVDADGHLDALFAGSPDDVLVLGDGSGGFVNVSSTLPMVGVAHRAVELGDVDADGDLDAVVGDPSSVLYENDGAGQFSVASPNLPAVLEGTTNLLLDDVDLDGDLDLLTINRPQIPGSTFQNHLFRNDGQGHFSDAPGFYPARIDTLGSAIRLGDVDGDGDPDLLEAAIPESRLLFNDGNGRFRDVGSQLPPSSGSYAAALVDVDGDGDPDAILDHFLLHNLRRQVAWRWRPRAGAPLTLDHYGVPGALWWIYGSPDRGRSGVPPYGTLLLDPGDTVFLASGALSPRGRASITFTPAQLSGLTGATLYVQSVIGTPLRFSNLEVVVFAGP